MTRLPFIALMLLALAACGIDGAPIPPGEDEPREKEETGITVSGDARLGTTVGF